MELVDYYNRIDKHIYGKLDLGDWENLILPK